jgi:hypothetical protein
VSGNGRQEIVEIVRQPAHEQTNGFGIRRLALDLSDPVTGRVGHFTSKHYKPKMF